MFSKSTKYYHLPQWQDNDKPTWLTDVNTAFENIDLNLKRIEEMAEEGKVPQSIINRIVALETSVTNILTKIGTDVIDTIGTSITNAIVNLNTAITNITTQIGNITISWADSITDAINKLGLKTDELSDRISPLETSLTNILAQIGNDSISLIGTSITNAIVNLNNAITNITTQIGNTTISDIGDTITQAIRNLADTIDIQPLIDRIVTLETSVTNILTKIGNIDISYVGNSITQAIVNLKDSLLSIISFIGNREDIIGIGRTITSAIANVNNKTGSIDIPTTSYIRTGSHYGSEEIYKFIANFQMQYENENTLKHEITAEEWETFFQNVFETPNIIKCNVIRVIIQQSQYVYSSNPIKIDPYSKDIYITMDTELQTGATATALIEIEYTM